MSYRPRFVNIFKNRGRQCDRKTRALFCPGQNTNGNCYDVRLERVPHAENTAVRLGVPIRRQIGVVAEILTRRTGARFRVQPTDVRSAISRVGRGIERGQSYTYYRVGINNENDGDNNGVRSNETRLKTMTARLGGENIKNETDLSTYFSYFVVYARLRNTSHDLYIHTYF